MYYYKTADGGFIYSASPILGDASNQANTNSHNHFETEIIANSVFDIRIQEMQQCASQDAYQKLATDLSSEAKTCVKNAFNKQRRVSIDKKTKKAVAKELTKEIQHEFDRRFRHHR